MKRLTFGEKKQHNSTKSVSDLYYRFGLFIIILYPLKSYTKLPYDIYDITR